MKFRAADGTVQLLRTVLVIAALGCGILLWLPHRFYAAWPPWAALLPVGVCAPLWWYVKSLASTFLGELTQRAVVWQCGKLWQREWYVPVTALRTFEVWAPPLHRLFRCRTVVLRFAGGSTYLPFLSCEDAARLTQRLEAMEEVV